MSHPRSISKFDHAELTAVEARYARHSKDRTNLLDEQRPVGHRVEDLIRHYEAVLGTEGLARRGPRPGTLSKAERRIRSKQAKLRWKLKRQRLSGEIREVA